MIAERRRAPAARRRDREVRPRHLLLQRRPRAGVRGGGAQPGRLAARRADLRPQARDERRARRPTRSSTRWRERRLPLRDHQLRQPRHGRPHRRDPGRGRRRSRRSTRCLGEVVDAVARRAAAPASITADHGNCDHMLEPDGSPNTAHSLNPVPLIVTADGARAARRRHPRRRRPDGARPARHRPAGGDDRPLADRCEYGAIAPKSHWPMRNDPSGCSFEIDARDGAPARASSTPPTGRSRRRPSSRWRRRARCAGSTSAEVAELGYELILGNTYHLFVSPGPERIAARRRAARVHGLGAGADHRLGRLPGLLARPRRRRQRGQGQRPLRRRPRLGGRDQRGGRPASARYRDGSELLHLARGLDGGAGGARLRHRPRLRRVHALPRRPRLHRPLDRAHPPLARPLPRLARRATGPARQAVFGIVQGGVHEDLRRESAEAVSAAGVDGIAIGGTLGRDKEEMAGGAGDDRCRCCPTTPPKHLLGIGEVDDLLGGIALGLDVFDCAVPTRLARHGVALAPEPGDPLAPRPAQGPAGTGTAGRWSRAAPARPARATTATTSATSRGPRS